MLITNILFPTCGLTAVHKQLYLVPFFLVYSISGTLETETLPCNHSHYIYYVSFNQLSRGKGGSVANYSLLLHFVKQQPLFYVIELCWQSQWNLKNKGLPPPITQMICSQFL